MCGRIGLVIFMSSEVWLNGTMSTAVSAIPWWQRGRGSGERQRRRGRESDKRPLRGQRTEGNTFSRVANTPTGKI